MKRLFIVMIITTLVVLTSCKKDENNDPEYCATAWATAVQDELTAVTNAAVTYAQNPTTENCTAYKAAYQNYIDAMEPYGNCSAWTAQQKADLQNQIDNAREEMDTLCD
jgi:hypothetical protein